MKTFLINLTYKKPIELIEKHLPEHIKYLDKYYESQNFVSSGRKNPRVGGIILCRFHSLEEVQAAVKEDPFYIYEISDFEIVEFLPSRGILA